MLVRCTDGTLEYNSELDLSKTLFCGQAFRWDICADGAFHGVAGYGDGERRISLTQADGDISASVSAGEFQSFWSNYFDLQTDYGRLDVIAESDPFLSKCLELGRGIHILRQDFWETLVSFILSQRSNIPRIKGCINSMVKIYGRFPAPPDILGSPPGCLDGIRCGYRAPYIRAAAEFSGYERLSGADYDQAKPLLKQIKGVGDKVADCVILFGLHDRKAFPVDTWIGRVIEREYAGKLKTAKFGEMAGIVQQYMFYYAINNKPDYRK